MDMLKDKKLMTKDCQSYKAHHYLKKTKILIFYFSASWVDDTRLLHKLKKIYEENLKREMCMEVIYVPADTDEKQFNKNFREHHGNWPGIAVKHGVVSEELRWRHGITCLPQIVVVKKDDGSVITRRGKEELDKYGINVLVAWSDYEPDLILPDDNLIDLSPPPKEEPKRKDEGSDAKKKAGDDDEEDGESNEFQYKLSFIGRVL